MCLSLNLTPSPPNPSAARRRSRSAGLWIHTTLSGCRGISEQPSPEELQWWSTKLRVEVIIDNVLGGRVYSGFLPWPDHELRFRAPWDYRKDLKVGLLYTLLVNVSLQHHEYGPLHFLDEYGRNIR